MRFFLTSPKLALSCAAVVAGTAASFMACTDAYRPAATGGSGGTTSSSSMSHGGGGGVTLSEGGFCQTTCSNDLKNVIDCNGNVVTACTVDQGCANGVCINDPCKAATESKSSYGCDYWALKTVQLNQAGGSCFAAFVANSWGKPLQINVSYGSQTLDPSTFAVIPKGSGQSVTYTPYDPAVGIPVGEVAIVFLSRNQVGAVAPSCPGDLKGVNGETGVQGTGIGTAFHITTNYPAVVYQMDPYGGGTVAVTSATLLLPVSAWDTNYIAVSAYGPADQTIPTYQGGFPSLAVVASQATDVTIKPVADITAGTGVAGTTAGVPATYSLTAGQFLQITQSAELTGSPISSTTPVGVIGAHAGMQVRAGQQDVDSAQQMIPPVKALGSEYVAVRYRGRSGGSDAGSQDESVPWRLVGAVDGTMLAWEPTTPPGAPTMINLGDVKEFSSPGLFVVQSQDGAHPFYLGSYMTGGGPGPGLDGGPGFNGEGDPEWVNVITPPQYLDDYVFFTDPTYSETNLVLVRAASKLDGGFADVMLTCAGNATPQVVSGWQQIGKYEYTRVDLVTGAFMGVNGCTNGRQELKSPLPFGVTVWGWGTPAQGTKLVSYGYPAGAGFQPINMVVVPTTQ